MSSSKASLKLQRSGSGSKNLLILNGWGASALYWQPILKYLERDFQLFFCDYPGVGTNYQSESSIFHYVQYLNESFDTPFSICAWSYGGFVATLLADLASDRVEGVSYLAANPCFVTRDSWPGMSQEKFQQFYQATDKDLEEQLVVFQSLVLGSAIQEHQHLKECMKNISIKKKSMLSQLQHLNRFDYRGLLSILQTKVQFLFGAFDLLVPSLTAKKIKNLKEGQVHMLASGSHAFFYQQPEQTAAILRQFCDD